MDFKKIVTFLLAASFASALFGAEFHVSVNGSDTNDGSQSKPFRTISAAARVAQAGDVITVHAGTYRERVTPPRGGESDTKRIIYRAAAGEVVEIKGSEVVRDWKPYRGDVWKVTLPKSFFGGYNPYLDPIAGDWFTDKGRPHHTGQVYINGNALFEAGQIEGVLNPLPYPDARDQDASVRTWFTESDANNIFIYANFHGKNPNTELAEINVRDSCFYPDQPGRNYITVSGFHMRHAATQWAAPTAEQIGLIGTHWSKGWIIENNVISDSRCSCVTLGKDRATGHNVWTVNPMKGGATHYNEVILRALEIGWSRDKIGSHIVRNNTISNCEQAGIAGSLGAINSRITGNHIYNVWARRQFTGAEMGGIKLHGAIDVLIKGNRIHNAGRGMWMDWMAQGTHITSNLLYDNTTDDLFFEVDHGPFLVDNNLFLSEISLLDMSEGGAYVHNYFGGKVVSRPELSRWTPYHRAHSTALAGVTNTNGGDNRFYNNIFNGGVVKPSTRDAPETLGVEGYGTWVYNTRRFPSFAAGNAYLNGAHPYNGETDPVMLKDSDPEHRVVEEGERVFLQITLDPGIATAHTVRVTTELLGKTQIAEAAYEEDNGSPLAIDADYFGKPFGTKRSPGPFATPGSGEINLRVW
jgi:hypothetical protein